MDTSKIRSALGIIEQARSEGRGLTAPEIAACLNATPADRKDEALAVVNLTGKNADLRAVDRRDALAAVLSDVDATRRANGDLSDEEVREQYRQRATEQAERAAAAEEAFRNIGLGARDVRSLSAANPDLDRAFRAALNNDRTPIVVAPTTRRGYYQPGLEQRDVTSANFVGTSFHNAIVRHLVESSAVLAAGATFIQTDTAETLKVPRSTANSTAAIVTEGNTIGESDPTISSASLTGFKYGFLVQVSAEMLRDASFDLVGFLAAQGGTAIGTAFGAHLITGNGSGQPRGVVNDATVGVTGGTGVAGVPSADNLIDLQGSLVEGYMRSPAAAFLMRNATWSAIRKIKETGSGGYVFTTDVPPSGSGAVGTLLGKPVFIDPNIPATGIGAKSVYFGDWSRVFVRQVGPVRWEASPDFAFDKDLVTFRGLTTLDAVTVDTSAIKVFQGGAS